MRGDVDGESGSSGDSRGGFEGVDAFHRRLYHQTPATLLGDTAQTAGMRRAEAISGKTVGSSKLWMGQTHVPPATASADHHHGESETAIFVVSGNPVFVFGEEAAAEDGTGGRELREVRLETRPGDYVFVPPYVPHREENPDPEHEAVVVIARSTQEAIVVNLPDLSWENVTVGGVARAASTSGDGSAPTAHGWPGHGDPAE